MAAELPRTALSRLIKASLKDGVRSFGQSEGADAVDTLSLCLGGEW